MPLTPMRFLFSVIFFFVAVSAGSALFAQEKEQQSTEQQFTIDTPASLDFKKEDEPVEGKKKKKVKKRVYYGIKTKKGFTRKGFGDRITYEIFYFLKTPEKPTDFVRDIFWYDFRQKAVRKTSSASFDPKNGVLLHGPYEKRQGEVVLQKGIYYKGTKHGRWVSYSRDSVLTDKEKYYRGWPRESLVTYYDPMDRKRMKEMTPIEFGEKEGFYYLFHDNGTTAVQGEYRWDEKVGDWTEYYPTGKRKRIISYPKEPFDRQMTPYIKIEWNEKGKEIYRNNKMVNN
jgi:antitoxin component YwqK of YwqJK toxin-antitoxin module